VCVWRTGIRDDYSIPPSVLRDLRIEAEIEHEGNVTDIQFADTERFAVASSSGCVTVMQHRHPSKTVDVSQRWERLHSCPGQSLVSCTALSVNPPDVVTVGEDGRINVMRIEMREPLLTIDADSCTITCVTCIRQSEVLTGSVGGQLKLWDVRQPTHGPAKILLLVGDPVALHCLDRHPNQQHIVATGGQDGVLSVWDTRQERSPMTQREAHTSNIWDVKFHPTCPDNLFTCSEDGSLWHWDATRRATPGFSSTLNAHIGLGITTGSGVSYSPWLLDDSGRTEIHATSLLPWHRMPLQSLDTQMRKLVCGTDSEAVIVINDLSIR
jgi:nuclear pore complex protein Nup43